MATILLTLIDPVRSFLFLRLSCQKIVSHSPRKDATVIQKAQNIDLDQAKKTTKVTAEMSGTGLRSVQHTFKTWTYSIVLNHKRNHE